MIVPALIEQVTVLSLYASDQILVGHFFETSHIAAFGTMTYLIILFYGIASLVAIGSAVMIARFSGEKNLSLVNHVLNQSIFLAMVLAVAQMIFWGIYAEQAIAFLGLQGESLAHATMYMRTLLWALPFIMIQMIGIANFHGSANMKTSLFVAFTISLTNIVVSWGCVTGFGPFPQLGWWGFTLGTTCGYSLGGFIMLLILLRGLKGRRLIFRMMIPNISLIRRILWIGVPGGTTVLVIAFSELWFVAQINLLGETQAAAHNICIRIMSLAYNPAYALYLVAMTLAGQYLGAKLVNKARKAIWTLYVPCFIYMLLLSVTFYVFRKQIPLLFLDSTQMELASTASELLIFATLILPSYAGTMVLCGGLQGAGDTRATFAITLIGFFCFRVTSIYFLAFDHVQLPFVGWTIPGMGLGVVGAWIALLLDNWSRCLLYAVRLLSNAWCKIKV